MEQIIKVKDSLVMDAVSRSSALLVSAKKILIKNQVGYDAAAEFRKAVKKEYVLIESQRQDMKEPILIAGRKVDDLFRPALAFLKEADTFLEKERLRYFQKQEQIRKEQEKKLQKEAEEKRAKLLKQEEDARAAGKEKKADKIVEKVERVVVPSLASSVEKTKGASMRKNWKYRVINQSLIPRSFLCLDEKKMAGFARVTKGTAQVMGIEFYFEETEIQKI